MVAKFVKCNGCGVEIEKAQLACPTCARLGLPPQHFCSQACFKKNWGTHKAVHKKVEAMLANDPSILSVGLATMKRGFDPNDKKTWVVDENLKLFLPFEFTGKLRPWPKTPRRGVPAEIPKPDYYLTGDPKSENVAKKQTKIVELNDEQIERLRECCLIAREALDVGARMIKPGVTTEAIDEAVHHFIVSKGGYPSPLNYCTFPKSICTSVNEVICHGIPDLRPLEDGDIINLDVTVYYKGMHGDLNETFFVGEVSEDAKRLVQGAYDCLMAAIEICKPDVLYREVGNVVHRMADKHKLSVVRSYCGHGVGELFHTTPNVPHYRHNKAVGVMKPGHSFTIEPMINAGCWEDKLWPDDWTSTTMDGKWSAQFEHTFLITKNGVEILTARLSTSPPIGIDLRPLSQRTEATIFDTARETKTPASTSPSSSSSS